MSAYMCLHELIWFDYNTQSLWTEDKFTVGKEFVEWQTVESDKGFVEGTSILPPSPWAGLALTADLLR